MTPTRPVTVPPTGLPPDECSAKALVAPRIPSDLSAAFLAENRWTLPLLDVMPDPRVTGPESFETYVRVNDSIATIVWSVRITKRNELLDIWAYSFEADGRALPVDTITEEEREYAEDWAQRNADEFPAEGE